MHQPWVVCRNHHVLFVYDFLQGTHAHGGTAQIVHLRWPSSPSAEINHAQHNNLAAILLVAFLLWAQLLLVCHKFLLHEQPVLDAFQLEQPQFALGIGCHGGDLGSQARCTITLALLASHAWWGGWGLPLLLLLVLRCVWMVAVLRIGCDAVTQQMHPCSPDPFCHQDLPGLESPGSSGPAPSSTSRDGASTHHYWGFNGLDGITMVLGIFVLTMMDGGGVISRDLLEQKNLHINNSLLPHTPHTRRV